MASHMTHPGGRHRGARVRALVWGSAALLLLLPLVAMQFTREVNWGPEDFIVMGLMLLAACGSYELAFRRSASTAYRAAAGIAIVTAFVLVWINLAVGVFGSEANPANLMFGGVLAVGLVGAGLARFRADGLARALVAMAVAQAAVAGIGLLLGYGPMALLAALFVLPWLASAHLFGVAARDHATRAGGLSGE